MANFALARTPMFDAQGNLTRAWLLYFAAQQGQGYSQGPLADLPALGLASAGYLYEASDVGHSFRWSGTAWGFAPGNASGYVAIGKPDGTAPTGGLWGLCDGSTYAITQSNGTTANVTTQNLTGGVFLKGDAPAAQQAATVATWQAGAATDTEASHTHSVGQGSVTQGTGGSATVDTAGGTGAGSAHGHNLSNTNAKLNTPSEANGGLPLRVGVRFYIRR